MLAMRMIKGQPPRVTVDDLVMSATLRLMNFNKQMRDYFDRNRRVEPILHTITWRALLKALNQELKIKSREWNVKNHTRFGEPVSRKKRYEYRVTIFDVVSLAMFVDSERTRNILWDFWNLIPVKKIAEKRGVSVRTIYREHEKLRAIAQKHNLNSRTTRNESGYYVESHR